MWWLVRNLVKVILLGVMLFGISFDEQLEGLARAKRPVTT